MIRLTLLVHGATAANRAATFPVDEPLEPRARAAAEALRGRFAPSEALASPALRARETAEALGLVARAEPALGDADVGRWAGLSMAEVEPAALAACMTDPDARPHGGESIAEVVARVAAWLESRVGVEGRCLAVTHVAVVRAAVVAVLGAPAAAFWRIDAPPLSATDLVSDGRRWTWRAARGSVPA